MKPSGRRMLKVDLWQSYNKKNNQYNKQQNLDCFL